MPKDLEQRVKELEDNINKIVKFFRENDTKFKKNFSLPYERIPGNDLTEEELVALLNDHPDSE